MSFLVEFFGYRRAVRELQQLIAVSQKQTDSALASASNLAALVDQAQANFDGVHKAMKFWENRCAELETKLALERAKNAA